VGRQAPDRAQPDDGFTHDDPVVDEALEWFAHLRGASPDAARQAEFDAWLRRDPRHAEEFRNLEAIWGSAAFGKAADSLHAAGRPAGGRARRQLIGTGWAGRLSAAAAVLLVALATWQLPPAVLRWQADYLTQTGRQSTIALPDGSTMILNTASAVAVDFADGRREVRLLQGEAFFDVLRDPDHPFRVAGEYGEVEVRGTAFSVRTDEDRDRIVLERGRVDVSRLADRAEHVALEPDQMVVATDTALSAATSIDTARALAWREGRIVFENRPLSQVIDELRRYHAGPILVMDSRLDRLAITGNYRLDDIDGAVRTIADAAGLAMTRLPGGIVILR